MAAVEEEHKKTAALAEGAKELDNNPGGDRAFYVRGGQSRKLFKAKKEPQLVVRQIHRQAGYALF